MDRLTKDNKCKHKTKDGLTSIIIDTNGDLICVLCDNFWRHSKLNFVGKTK